MSASKASHLQSKPALKTAKEKGNDAALLSLAFQHSLHPTIVTRLNKKILQANAAACELLGYSLPELLTKRLSDFFEGGDKVLNTFIKTRLVSGKAKLLVTLIKKSGENVSCELSSVIFTDDQDVKLAVTTITDRTEGILHQKKIDNAKEIATAVDKASEKARQQNISSRKEREVADNIAIAIDRQKRLDSKKDKKVALDILLAQAKADDILAKNSEWIRFIAKASYDVMWDWNITTGDIYIGDSAQETFGYIVNNNMVSITELETCLLPEDKAGIKNRLQKVHRSKKKEWKDAFVIRRKNGQLAATTSRASIVRDEDGRALRMIGATQDISTLENLEKQIKDNLKKDDNSFDIFDMAAMLCYDGIWDWNIETNEFFFGDGFEKIFGNRVSKQLKKSSFDLVHMVHPEDRERVQSGMKAALVSDAIKWQDDYRFLKRDGSISPIVIKANIVRDHSGKACRMIGVVHDMSAEKALEEKLELEIKLKELQIAEAIEDARDTERADIGKELHDNVNQLLGASRLYLEMAKRGGERSESYLGRSSEYTLTAINEIRKLTKGLTTDVIKNLGLVVAIENFVQDITEIGGIDIKLQMKTFNEAKLSEKFKLNIFRILQEQVNNILKHAGAKDISIRLSQTATNISLTISDDGVGFDTAKQYPGIGLANIKSRVASYDGITRLISSPGNGCRLVAKFPLSPGKLGNIANT